MKIFLTALVRFLFVFLIRSWYARYMCLYARQQNNYSVAELLFHNARISHFSFVKAYILDFKDRLWYVGL